MNDAPPQQTHTQLDVGFVRSRFPGVESYAFFENAGGSLVPQSVIDRISDYMRETQVQPGAPYGPSALAAERMAAGQRWMADFVNASPDEVIIGASTTSNVYNLAQAFRQILRPGDEVVVTNLDHEANNGAWRRLAESGATIREWRWNQDTGRLEADTIDTLLTERTRLVCFTHLSNITGTLNDVRTITARAHDAGALACVDGVACAPHRRIDVLETDVDFYLFSPYKVFGPHLGVLYGKREQLERLPRQNHFFLTKPPLRNHAGYPNHELTAGLVGTGEYFESLYRHHFGADVPDRRDMFQKVYSLIAHHEEQLSRRFLDFAKSCDRVRLIGTSRADQASRAPTFSFVVEGRDAAELPRALGRRGIGISSGDFYARRCIDSLNLGTTGGVIRASMVHYNTLDEVDRLTQALDETI